MLRLAEDIVDFGIKKGIDNRGIFLKQVFNPNFDIATLAKEEVLVEAATNKTNLGLFYQIDDYIKSKEKKVTGGTLGVYRQMREHLLAFQQHIGNPITFESFDYTFNDGFVNSLTHEFIQKRRKEIIKGLKVNTIGKSIKHFRGFIKDRIKRKIIPAIDGFIFAEGNPGKGVTFHMFIPEIQSNGKSIG